VDVLMARRTAAFSLVAFLHFAGLPAMALELGLPADCEPGRTCFLQQYFDHDSGPGVRDYACGKQTYDGHDGLDLRLRTVKDSEQGTAVLASASGRVVGMRDGVPDHLVRTEEDRKLITERECGNGVLLDHGDGWQTQYCHMRNGSVKVRKGEAVEAGQALGNIGYSGAAGFPHVHLTVRRNGKAIDPFRGQEGGEACGLGERPLWKPEVVKALAYEAGRVLDLGLAGGAVAMQALELGLVQGFVPDRDSPALVAWVWAINLRQDDRIVVSLTGPEGELARNEATLDRHKAQYMLFSGKKRPAGGWPAGQYVASVEVERDGKVAVSERRSVTLK
jgi:hypothetical protein